jgi:trehalose/maltose transport system substrate-binding protein
VAALYDDAEVLAAIPFLDDAKQAFDESVSRPSAVAGGDYNQVSTAFYQAVHAVLSGEDDAEDALAGLESDLQRIKERGGW